MPYLISQHVLILSLPPLCVRLKAGGRDQQSFCFLSCVETSWGRRRLFWALLTCSSVWSSPAITLGPLVQCWFRTLFCTFRTIDPKSLPKVCPKSAQSRPKVSHKSASSRPQVCPKSAQSWFKVGQKSPKVGQTSGKSRLKVGQKLAKSWPKVGPKSWPKVGQT